ncbi:MULTISPECIES: hypothetical protein [Microbacterium]|uniref:hypothetical protein n=1 Tax=Microbacterium TaxID=33882 RepID=UPI00249E9621|nr:MULTISPECIES: hypothetical protein [Microbacterium]WHE37621.1 hypothetical protein P6897_07935 [Microbacterium sp. BDGP8]WRK18800.1 hypothetical protein VC184_07325 [Microbacterium plantarum]
MDAETTTIRRGDPADEVGRGPLSRGAAFIYRQMVLEAQLLLASLPSVVAVLLLDRDPSNVPLFVLALLPVAPALVAGVAAAMVPRTDLSPGRHFFRAYGRELVPTLRWAAPAAVALALLAFNLVHLDGVDGGATLRPLYSVLGLLILVWAGHMVVLTAGFHCRARDAARVAAAQLASQWRFSLGVLSLLIVTVFLVIVVSETVVLLLLWAFAGLLALMARPLLADTARRFTPQA